MNERLGLVSQKKSQVLLYSSPPMILLTSVFSSLTLDSLKRDILMRVSLRIEQVNGIALPVDGGLSSSHPVVPGREIV